MKKKTSQHHHSSIPFNREGKGKIPHCARIPDAPITEFLFSDIRVAWVWLVIRVYVGYEWLTAGLDKLYNPAWVGENAGAAVMGFTGRALEKASGEHPDVQGWYAWFLEHVVQNNAEIFSYLVVWGEILVGVALILGILVGASAFAGTFMNANFLLAGTVSINPILIFFQLLLILAYRTAGWYGVDRYILKYLGTPWAPGHLFVEDECER